MIDCAKTLDRYLATVGKKKTLEMVHFSLSYIDQREKEIANALLRANKKLAADLAHKALGSVKFYGTSRLEALLSTIRDGNYRDSEIATLQSELSSEFMLATNNLERWLTNHN